MSKPKKQSVAVNNEVTVVKPAIKHAKSKIVRLIDDASAQRLEVATKKDPVNRTTKQGILITLLQKPAGATLEELVEATGWQRHSVHGVMSGVLKKKLGLSIISDKEARGRVYRVAGVQ